MRNSVIELLDDEGGATALEYGLMAAAIAGVLTVVAYFLGGKVNNKLSNVAAHL
jgi:Flp pilus assembly pilin Flp